jgi:tetratricopeptide (TPR) repeat protein
MAAEARALADLKLTRGSLGWVQERLDGPELAYLPESGPVRLQLAGEVLKLYQDLFNMHRDDPDLRFELARARRISANIGRSMGEAGETHQRYDGAIRLLDALARIDPDSDRYRLERARARHDFGEYLRMAGQPRLAEEEQIKAIEALKPRGGAAIVDDRSTRMEASSLINLAVAQLETGRPRQALPHARRAVEMLTPLAEKPRVQQHDRLLHIYALNARAASLMASGDREGARKDLEVAAGLARELNKGRENTDTQFALGMVLDSQGLLFAEAGDQDEAIKRFDEANAILLDLYRKNQRFVFIEKELAVSWNGRGTARLAIHRVKPSPSLLDSAQSDCEQARASLERIAKLWPGNFIYQSLLGQSLGTLGRIALVRDKKEEARDLLEQSLARHQLALDANRESPDDPKRIEIIRDELKEIEPTRVGSAPGS